MFDKNYNEDSSSPERYAREEVLIQKEKLEKSNFLHKLLLEVPLSFLILNDKRQVIYSNKVLLKQLGYSTLDDVLGMRPGEIFRCKYAYINPEGCGTSVYCNVCGAVNAVKESDEVNNLVEKEARLTTVYENIESAHDFSVASKPFDYEEERFFIVSLADIENAKKRERLERIFFHDILNKVGSLKGILEVIDDSEDEDRIEKYTDIMHLVVDEVFKDIHFQRKLIEAEKGILTLNKEPVNTLQMISDLMNSFKYVLEKEVKSVVLDITSQKVEFETDKVLLNRILTNMLINAFEASEPGDIIHIGTVKEDAYIKFWVHNPVVIPDELQLDIFQRSFSTKGDGRGIGTYSIKLFTEQYLNGKASFISNSKEGTVFSILLPIE